MTTQEILDEAAKRYDALINKPDWKSWYYGFIAGAAWMYSQSCPECAPDEHLGAFLEPEKQ